MAQTSQTDPQNAEIQSSLFHGIPPEILSEVVNWGVHSYRSKINGTAGFNFEVMTVCRRWRDIMRTNPQVWSHLDVRLDDIYSDGDNAVRTVAAFLRLSSTTALTIRLSVVLPGGYIDKIFTMLFGEKFRWRSMFISGLMPTLLCEVEALLSTSPLLSFGLVDDANHLREELQSRQCQFVLPYSSVRNLHFEGTIDYDQFFEIFEKCSSLAKLHFLPPDFELEHPRRHIISNSLKSITMVIRIGEITMLEHISAPNLLNLCLRVPDGGHQANGQVINNLDSILVFLHHLAETLQVLRLTVKFLDDQQIREIVESCNVLEDLELYTDLYDASIRAAVPRPGSRLRRIGLHTDNGLFTRQGVNCFITTVGRSSNLEKFTATLTGDRFPYTRLECDCQWEGGNYSAFISKEVVKPQEKIVLEYRYYVQRHMVPDNSTGPNWSKYEPLYMDSLFSLIEERKMSLLDLQQSKLAKVLKHVKVHEPYMRENEFNFRSRAAELLKKYESIMTL